MRLGRRLRVAEPRHVRDEHAEARGERQDVPDPVGPGAARSVEQHQRRPLAPAPPHHGAGTRGRDRARRQDVDPRDVARGLLLLGFVEGDELVGVLVHAAREADDPEAVAFVERAEAEGQRLFGLAHLVVGTHAAGLVEDEDDVLRLDGSVHLDRRRGEEEEVARAPPSRAPYVPSGSR